MATLLEYLGLDKESKANFNFEIRPGMWYKVDQFDNLKKLLDGMDLLLYNESWKSLTIDGSGIRKGHLGYDGWYSWSKAGHHRTINTDAQPRPSHFMIIQSPEQLSDYTQN